MLYHHHVSPDFLKDGSGEFYLNEFIVGGSVSEAFASVKWCHMDLGELKEIIVIGPLAL